MAFNAVKKREERRHCNEPTIPPRTPYQRDRERILHSSAFRRLAGITQVVSAAEGHVFHNRLTHALKVAQIGKGISEVLNHKSTNRELAVKLGGLDPDAVEAVGYAHDLGHPPFGHIAEKQLHKLVIDRGVDDGFEGNAQSFHIVTKLAVLRTGQEGLNLTRATLAALLKYPWSRSTDGKKKSKKWGYYHCDKDDAEWAREFLLFPKSDHKSLEAEVMDWADDIAYSVYDLEDFYKAGRIPLHQLFATHSKRPQKHSVDLSPEAEIFIKRAFDRWGEEGESFNKYRKSDFEKTFKSLASLFPISGPYTSSVDERATLRNLTSTLIHRYMFSISLNKGALTEDVPRVFITPEAEMEVRLLKEITWQYAICNPALSHQQHGQRQIIEKLFTIFCDAASSQKDHKMFPQHLQDILGSKLFETDNENQKRVRLVADFIANLGEQQAIELYLRLTGSVIGSVMHNII